MGKGSYGEPDWANPDNTTAAPTQDVGVTGSVKQSKSSRYAVFIMEALNC